jgi:predicted MPP superfamily phosphohydrolase
MERVIERLIFISILLTFELSIHLYSYLRLASFFQVNRRWWHYLIIVFLSIFLILATILCRYYFNILTRGIYMVAACWFAISFMLCFTTLAFDLIRIIFKLDGLKTGIGIVSFIAITSIASIINAQFIHVKTVEIPSFGKEMKAVLLSDLHIGTIWSKEYLRSVVEKTNALQPDVVFITGDIVSGGAVLQEDSLEPLDGLKAQTFFVYGNHEYYEGIDTIKQLIHSNGVRTLCDEKVEFEGIDIIGLDYHRGEDPSALESYLNGIDISDERPTVLLTHAPIDPKNQKIDLVLAGHTHAGQIFPFNFFIRLRYPFIKGLYDLGNTKVYVTPGTNTWGPPMRLGSRNEITLLILH